MASAYTQTQIAQYMKHIQLPERFRSPDYPRDIELLTALHVHQISSIPYDNIELHYSQHHKNSLEPQRIFEKFVGGRIGDTRGGYYMETAIFFRHILLALGFEVYTAGARIRTRKNGVPEGDFGGWVHCVNLVTLSSGQRYMVDVGFGGDGATRPLPMLHHEVVQNLGTQQVRLSNDHFPNSPKQNPKFWFYEYRNNVDKEWNRFYGFSELEFTQADFEIMNHWARDSVNKNQAENLMCIIFLRGEDCRKPEIIGKRIIFNDQLKENTGQRTKVLQIFRSELQRIEALQTRFGVLLTRSEQEGIRGRLSELSTSYAREIQD